MICVGPWLMSHSFKFLTFQIQFKFQNLNSNLSCFGGGVQILNPNTKPQM